jgi:GTP cyclohydrolase II
MLEHAEANLPTRFGTFRVHAFGEVDGKEHVALVRGEVLGEADVPVRIHSECATGDLFGSLRCDCGEQLDMAMRTVGTMPLGIVIYLRQEGRGIGLSNKLRAYRLQELGCDTVDANLALGFRDDERDYRVASMMLATLGVESIALMTNNPDKIAQLRRLGVRITRRVPHAVRPGPHNAGYLETKARRAGHVLEVP